MKKKTRFQGNVIFDGKLSAVIGGRHYTFDNTFMPQLDKADPNREVIVMTPFKLRLNEFYTGYVRKIDYGGYKYLLIPTPSDDRGTPLKPEDVLCWTYADSSAEDLAEAAAQNGK